METIALKDQMNNEEVKENQAQELTALVKMGKRDRHPVPDPSKYFN